MADFYGSIFNLNKMEGNKNYTNGEITVVWQPKKCIHSAICFRGLPQVFDPRVHPWVNIEGAETERIINQVTHCPSGALSFFINDTKENV